MEQKKLEVSTDVDKLPPLVAKYPWFVVQDLQDLGTHHFFSNLYNPLFKYCCQVPELSGKRIRGCFHGWMVLSNHPRNDTWSLWNPSSASNNIISLPTLILEDEDYDSIRECCLSAPPDDPTSILLLTRRTKPTFVFCKLSPPKSKKLRKKPRWTEMSYAYQLERITLDGDLLHSLTCCNGKIYALCTDSFIARFVIQVEIIVKDREVVIPLLLFGSAPFVPSIRCSKWVPFLKGSGTELFYITVGFLRETDTTPGDVYLFKLDTTSINWKELEGLKKWDISGLILDELEQEGQEALNDLGITQKMWKLIKDVKDAIFFLDLGRDTSIYYNPPIASELGGYIHIRGRVDNVLYSYHLNNTTIFRSLMPSPVLPTSHVSMLECRLEDDHVEAKCAVGTKQEEGRIAVRSVTNDQAGFNDSPLLNIPFDVLKMILEFCVGVEYMNFRATCKLCYLAAPVVRWGSKNVVRRLQNYSLVSPWLMVVEKNRGIISFTDPLLGGNYFMETKLKIDDDTIHYSRFGWLLYKTGNLPVVFYNPFTDDYRELPKPNYCLYGLCFSAPPTSPDCMVVGFTCEDVLIHFVARPEQTWHIYVVGDDPRQRSLSFPTFYDGDVYAFCNNREVVVFKNVGKEDLSRSFFDAEPPTSICRSKAQYFLAKCDQHLLQVVLGGFGEPIEVFKRNDSTQQWEKVSSIGKHMIYICNTTCLCTEAKTPEMENKIYLPRLSSTNKIVFYSLETCTYLSFNGKSIQEKVGDLFTTAHLSAQAWIEPSWLVSQRPRRKRVSQSRPED